MEPLVCGIAGGGGGECVQGIAEDGGIHGGASVFRQSHLISPLKAGKKLAGLAVKKAPHAGGSGVNDQINIHSDKDSFLFIVFLILNIQYHNMNIKTNKTYKNNL